MTEIKSNTRSTAATLKAVRAPFLAKPIQEIDRNATRYLLWALFQKFITRHTENHFAGKKDSQLAVTLCSDIAAFCEQLAAPFQPLSEAEAKKLMNKEVLSKEDVLRAFKSIKKRAYEPKATYYNDLRNDIYSYAAYTTGNITVEIPRLQLEAMCLYATEHTFDEFKHEKHRMYIGGGSIQFIKTKLSEHFGDFLCKMLTAIESFNHSDSPNLIKIVLELLSEETETIIDALNKSKIYRPKNEYLNTLYRLMEKASAGFGVNIFEFNEIWKTEIGEKILKINQEQIKGRITNDGQIIEPFPYRRIFLMYSENVNEFLSTSSKDTVIAEKDAIKRQLQYSVLVYCIFKDDWKLINSADHSLFDYAILKVDNCPMLMGTKFGQDKNEIEKGIFYTDTNKAISHYEDTLGKLLTNPTLKVYQPFFKNGKSKIEFKLLEEWEKVSLIKELKAAATC